MATLNINVFDGKSIIDAQRLIAGLAKSVQDAEYAAVTKITEKLAMRIRENMGTYPRNAEAGGTLEGSSAQASIRTEYEYIKGHWHGRIYGADYLIYLEYGTGELGAASVANPNQPAGWAHSGESWVYKDPVYGFVTTHGQPAKPFMYTASIQTKAELPEYVDVAFSQWLRRTKKGKAMYKWTP